MTTTTPQQEKTKSKFPANMYMSMRDRMADAIQNREKFYQGLDEAASDWLKQTPGSPVLHASDEEAARQIFQNSSKGKVLIGNNRWHMAQAIMFGVADLAHSARLIVVELRAIRQALEKQDTIPRQRKG